MGARGLTFQIFILYSSFTVSSEGWKSVFGHQMHAVGRDSCSIRNMFAIISPFCSLLFATSYSKRRRSIPMEKRRSLILSSSSRLSPKASEVIAISWERHFPVKTHSMGCEGSLNLCSRLKSETQLSLSMVAMCFESLATVMSWM